LHKGIPGLLSRAQKERPKNKNNAEGSRRSKKKRNGGGHAGKETSRKKRKRESKEGTIGNGSKRGFGKAGGKNRAQCGGALAKINYGKKKNEQLPKHYRRSKSITHKLMIIKERERGR